MISALSLMERVFTGPRVLAEQKPDISFHILDLRTLLPLDYEAIREAVAKTGKVIVLHEDTLTGGIGGEISAWIGEHCFELLDAPVLRCASLDTAVPFNIELEKNFLANARLWETVEKLLDISLQVWLSFALNTLKKFPPNIFLISFLLYPLLNNSAVIFG